MFRKATVLELLRGAMRAFLGKGLSVVASFALTLVIARMLGPADTGVFFLALTIVTVLGIFSRVGLDQVVVRETAAARAAGAQADISPVFYRALGIVASAALVLAGLLWFGAPSVSELVFSKIELTVPLQLLSAAILPLSILFLAGSFFAGLYRVGISALLQTGLVPLLATVALIILGSAVQSLSGIATTYVIAAMASAIVVLPFVTGALAGEELPERKPSVRRLLRSGLPLLMFGAFNMMLAWTDIVVLGIYGSSAEVGAYTVANRTAMLVGLMIYAVNAIAAPKMAALHGSGQTHEVKGVIYSGIALSVLAGLPIIALIYVFPGHLLGIFGSGFVAGSVALVILATGYFLNAVFSLYALALIMCGYEKPVRNLSALAAFVNLVLNLVLIPRFGVAGAAGATAFSVVLKNGLSYIYIVRRTNLLQAAKPADGEVYKR